MNAQISLFSANLDKVATSVDSVIDSWQGKIWEDEFGNWLPYEAVVSALKAEGANLNAFNENWAELDAFGDIETGSIEGQLVFRMA